MTLMTHCSQFRCFRSFAFLLVALIALPHAIRAADAPQSGDDKGSGIAGVVNEEIISTVDVENRVRLVIGTTGLTDSPEVRARLKPQIIRALIDEKLQLQDALRNGVSVNQQDIDQAIGTIESQRGRPPGSLLAHMEANNLPKLSLYDQLRAQIGWTKLVLKKLRPRVKVGEEELQVAREKLAAGPAVDEVQISVVALPVGSPAEEDNVRKLAEKLVGEVRAGASFEAVASQVSRVSSDATGGEAFWVQLQQLDPIVAGGIKSLKPGEISDVIHTAGGYQIVKLLDKRAGSVDAPGVPRVEAALKQILLSLKPEAKQEEANILLDIARAVAKHPGNCNEKGVAGVENLKEVDIAVTFLRRTLDVMPADVRRIVEKLKVGDISEPFATPKGLQLIMLCERIEMPAAAEALPERDKVREQIFQEKLALEAEKYMRSLRREAFIDIRQ